MPLTTYTWHKMVPTSEGGWYWLKLAGQDWQPVKVEPAPQDKDNATVTIASRAVEVQDVDGEWGPQIVPPQ